MPRLFISHSSTDNEAASVLHDWLVQNGWNDVFLDLHPASGLAPGESWQQALKAAAHECEAVLALISRAWLDSAWCRAEVQTAKLLGKRIFPILLTDISPEELPIEVRGDHQAVKLLDPLAYERLKEGLRRAGLDAATFPFPAGRRPYPGLEPLTEDDAAIFFGREAQIVRGLDRLRSLRDRGVERLLVILAASGAGKSSFLRAGLIPRLRRDNRAFIPLQVIRPEQSILTGKMGLISALETALNDPDVVRRSGQKLPRSRAEIVDYLDTASDGMAGLTSSLIEAWQPSSADGEASSSPTVVLSIDQGEELIDAEGRAEVDRFMDILDRTLASEKRLLVIVAVRSDAFPALQRLEAFAKIPMESFSLPIMLEGSFQLVIEGPAGVARPRLNVEPALVQALLEDARGQDALPLLAFTLERLYREHHSEGQLSLAHYERLGRISGALDAAVTDAFSKARDRRELPTGRQALEALLRTAMIPHLCRINEADEFARRVAHIDEIPPSARPLIDLMVEQRLLVRERRKTDQGEFDIVEVAHEALLREWPVLNGWLMEEREFLMWRADVERAHRRWAHSHGAQRQDALAAATALAGSDWFSRRHAEIDPELRRLLDLTKSKRRLLLGIGLLASFPVALWLSFSWLDHFLDLSELVPAEGASVQIRYDSTTPILVGYSAAVVAYFVFASALIAKAIAPKFSLVGSRAVGFCLLSLLVCVSLLKFSSMIVPTGLLYLP